MAPSDPTVAEAAADTELRDAVTALYQMFSKYELAEHVDGCPCCVHDDDQTQVRSRPLRELDWEDLGRYAGKAMTTWGGVEDYKHFMPRIFELLVSEAYFDPQIVIGKLEYGEWLTWPPEERKAIERFLLAAWSHLLLSTDPPEYTTDASDWLSAAAIIRMDLTRHFEIWVSLQYSLPMRHLRSYLYEHRTSLLQRTLRDAFLEDHPQAMAAIVKQVLSRTVLECARSASAIDPSLDEPPYSIAESAEQLSSMLSESKADL